MVNADVDETPIASRLAPKQGQQTQEMSVLPAPGLFAFSTAPAALPVDRLTPAPLSRVTVAAAGALACELRAMTSQVHSVNVHAQNLPDCALT